MIPVPWHLINFLSLVILLLGVSRNVGSMYFNLNGAWVLYSPWFIPYRPSLLSFMQGHAGMSLLVMNACIFMPISIAVVLVEVGKLLIVLDAVWMLTGGGSLMSASSVDAGLFGMSWLLFPWPIGLFLVVVAAYLKGVTGILAAFVSLVVYLSAHRKWLLVLLGLPVLGIHQFLGTIRWTMWTTYFDWWTHHCNPIVGCGTGVFYWQGPNITIPGFELEHYFWMHNDFLQILFEQGALGLIIAISFLTHWFIKNKDPKFRGVLAGFCIFMLFYSPLRLVPILGFMASLIKKVQYDHKL